MLKSPSPGGGLTWGAAKQTADSAPGLAGQPVVQPNGTVVVPYASAFEDEIDSFTSIDGGASWSPHTKVTTVEHHTVAGSMRSGALPSAEVDGAGRVYVVWEDCRFRGSSCPDSAPNDIIMASSSDGTTWLPSAIKRIPLNNVAGAQEDFVPGLAVDPATSGTGAHLALAYHYLPTTPCDFTSCQVHVGFARSNDGGAGWSAPVDLTGPM